MAAEPVVESLLPLMDNLSRALEGSAFEELRRQEREGGFREARAGQPFFREGLVGSWRDALKPEQAARIVRDIIGRSCGASAI